MSDNDVRAEQGHRGRGRLAKTLWLGGVVAALLAAFLLGSLIGPYAVASPGHMFWAGGHGCPIRGSHHGVLRDPAQAREHARFAAEWVLRSVNATEDQKAQVGSIVEGLADDLLELAPEHRENRQALLKALGEPQVDRAALEKIREAEIRVVERASTRLVEALGEVAGALTAEQRTALVEAVERFHH
jgi:Spy/CpxP family protein refolding chaperone